MKIVIVAGGFDPLHRGHLDHLRKARQLGDLLIVVTHSDEILIKKKDYCLLPFSHRVELLREMRCVDLVVASIDEDGTVAKTLEWLSEAMIDYLSSCGIKPLLAIFAKGGDRTRGNMPQNEIEVCKRLGIEIRYGIGEKLASSQDLVSKAIIQKGVNSLEIIEERENENGLTFLGILTSGGCIVKEEKMK